MSEKLCCVAGKKEIEAKNTSNTMIPYDETLGSDDAVLRYYQCTECGQKWEQKDIAGPVMGTNMPPVVTWEIS